MNDRSMTVGLLCATCRYDLSGSAMTGACPECGHPVALSWDRANDAIDKSVVRFRKRWRLLAWVTESVGWLWSVSAVVGVLGVLVYVALPQRSGGTGPGDLVRLGAVPLGCVTVVSGIGSIFWWVEWVLLARRSDASLWPGLSGIARRALLLLIAVPALVALIRITLFILQWEPRARYWLLSVEAVTAWLCAATLIAYTRRVGFAVARSMRTPVRAGVLALLNGTVAIAHLAAIFSVRYGRVADSDRLWEQPPDAVARILALVLPALATGILYVLWGREMRRLGAALPETARGYRETLGLVEAPPPVPAA